MTLTEFLLARVAEDETMARQSSESGWAPGSGGLYWKDRDGGEIAIDPARLLAECEAKRRIVALCDLELTSYDQEYADMPNFASAILRSLAWPHADHSDYRDEWKP